MNDNIPIENVEIASNNIFVISEYLISELSVVFCIISIITDTDHTRSYKINIIKNEYINVVIYNHSRVILIFSTPSVFGNIFKVSLFSLNSFIFDVYKLVTNKLRFCISVCSITSTPLID